MQAGDIVFFSYRPDADPRDCLNELVASVTGTPWVHCAIVEEDGDDPMVIDVSFTGVQRSLLSDIEGIYGARVVKAPNDADRAAVVASAQEWLPGEDGEPPEDREAVYAFDRLLMAALASAADHDDDRRTETLALVKMASDGLEALLANAAPRFMCAEFAERVLNDAGAAEVADTGDTENAVEDAEAGDAGAAEVADAEAEEAPDAEEPEDTAVVVPPVPELGAAFNADCWSGLAELVPYVANKIAASDGLPAGVRDYFENLAEPEAARAFVEDIALASDDPARAEALIDTLRALAAELTNVVDGPPYTAGDLWHDPRLGADDG